MVLKLGLAAAVVVLVCYGAHCYLHERRAGHKPDVALASALVSFLWAVAGGLVTAAVVVLALGWWTS